MYDRQRQTTVSCKGAARAVPRRGRLVRSLSFLALLLALTACVRGGGVAPSAFGGGSGTESDPYLIATEAHLRDLAAAPTLYGGKHFLQIADIRLNGEWVPIGRVSEDPLFTDNKNPVIRDFSGRYNGNGHKITGLTIKNNPYQCSGLFGSIGAEGEVRNLTVETSPEGLSSTRDYTLSGIIVGYNIGVIENCITRGRVEGGVRAGGIAGINEGVVKNCVNHAAIASNGVCIFFSAGGIAGENNGVRISREGLITGCTNYGPVAAASNAGGIVAENIGTVQDCVNNGSVSAKGDPVDITAGGVAGTNRTLIARCRNTGTIRASGLKATFAGGLVGVHLGKMTDSYSSVDASAKGDPSGHGVVVGKVLSGGILSRKIINCGKLRQ